MARASLTSAATPMLAMTRRPSTGPGGGSSVGAAGDRPHPADRLAARPHDDLAGVAVDEHLRAARHQFMDGGDAADGRNAQGPGQDGGMRGQAAARRDDAQDFAGVQVDDRRGREFLGHDDAPVAALARRFAGAVEGRAHLAQDAEEPPLDLAQVRGPFPQVRAVHLGQAGLVGLQGPHDGGLGACAAVDHLQHHAVERRVGDDHGLRGKDAGLGLAQARGHDLLEGRQVLADDRHGAAEAGLLGLPRLGRHAHIRHVVGGALPEEARPRQDRPRADREAAESCLGL